MELVQTQFIREKWLPALRSGDYKQGERRLRVADTFCCLGVLCEVAGLTSRVINPQFSDYAPDAEFAFTFGDSEESTTALPIRFAELHGLSNESIFIPVEYADEYREWFDTTFGDNVSEYIKEAKDDSLVYYGVPKGSIRLNLTGMNDSGDFSFEQIADAIEKVCDFWDLTRVVN